MNGNDRLLRPSDSFPFQCTRCGACCRGPNLLVGLETSDAFRLARFLRAQGTPIRHIEELIGTYAEIHLLAGRLPALFLKTTGNDDACIFLENNSCSIQPAKPRVCRLYPISAGPGTRGHDLDYYLCLEQPRHHCGKAIPLKQWVRQCSSKDDREYLKEEYAFATELGKLHIPLDKVEMLLPRIMYFRFFNFDLNKPFMGQYTRNQRALMEYLRQESRNW